MKMRLTILDEGGAELVSQVFDIGGQNDYQQATNAMWDRLREKFTKKGDDSFWNSPFEPDKAP
jgi:hypothetical protein